MPFIADINAFLREIAPLDLAEEWDNVGLLVGDEGRACGRVMTCLTLTAEVAAEAVREKAQLVVSHHPLLFRPVQRVTAAEPEGRMLLDLIAAGVAVYSPHTGYDSAADGINRQLAELLELRDVAPLRARGGIASGDRSPGAGPDESPGAGRYGTLPRPILLRELIGRVREALAIERLQSVGSDDAPITRVGIACGAGAEFLSDAAARGCEALVTGEARFHACLEARARGIALVLPGHYATERPAMERLAEILGQRFPEIAVWASAAESDPLRWW
ncbi:MAG: Nif3-like dinuclear metal center hexameric protein [Planctomycetales bacterium]